MVKQYIEVEQYNEHSDTFVCSTTEEVGKRFGDAILFTVPAVVMPSLIREYGAPDELVGRVFEIEQP